MSLFTNRGRINENRRTIVSLAVAFQTKSLKPNCNGWLRLLTTVSNNPIYCWTYHMYLRTCFSPFILRPTKICTQWGFTKWYLVRYLTILPITNVTCRECVMLHLSQQNIDEVLLKNEGWVNHVNNICHEFWPSGRENSKKSFKKVFFTLCNFT